MNERDRVRPLLIRQTAVQCVALAAVYFVAGRLGLLLDPVGGFATLVWPPAGIALAALLLFGIRLWPGIAAGAFLVNATAGAPIAVAIGIAFGNTLEAIAATYTLRRLPDWRPALQRTSDLIALILIAATTTAFAATIGVASLVFGGVVAGAAIREAWVAWWFGDGMGILTVAPLILTWATGSLQLRGNRALEAAGLAIALAATTWLVFLGRPGGVAAAFWQAYLLSPMLLWAAIRFPQRGNVTAIFLVSVIAVYGTAIGSGPFRTADLSDRLQDLQIFMAVTTVTFLMLGAVAAQQRASEAALKVAKEEAETASRVKSQFLAVVSHELRTPLTGIIGYADLLEQQITGPLSEPQRSQVGRIKAAAWHLVGVIDSILTFSSAERGRQEVKPAAVDAVGLARDAMALIEPQARAKGLIPSVIAPAEPVNIFTDAGKVNQILVNLLGNAVKFSDSGHVELEVAQENDFVIFSVRDQGAGIAPENRERIFEPFTQLDQSMTRAQGGAGLGLSVARTLVHLLGGSITLHSTAGSGSTFDVRLPVHSRTMRSQ
jgi:signal transduction histidine kinase